MDQRSVRIRVEADIIGPLNPSFVHFGFQAETFNIQQAVAQCLAYMDLALDAEAHDGVRMRGADVELNPGEGYVAINFPTVEYQRLVLINPTLGGAGETHYGWESGSSGSAASIRGASVCVNTKKATKGRSGRHYLPFMRSSIVSANGLIGGVATTQIDAAWRTYIGGYPLFDGTFSGTENFEAAVLGATGPHLISVAKASTQASRLRSRTK